MIRFLFFLVRVYFEMFSLSHSVISKIVFFLNPSSLFFVVVV